MALEVGAIAYCFFHNLPVDIPLAIYDAFQSRKVVLSSKGPGHALLIALLVEDANIVVPREHFTLLPFADRRYSRVEDYHAGEVDLNDETLEPIQTVQQMKKAAKGSKKKAPPPTQDPNQPPPVAPSGVGGSSSSAPVPPPSDPRLDIVLRELAEVRRENAEILKHQGCLQQQLDSLGTWVKGSIEKLNSKIRAVRKNQGRLGSQIERMTRWEEGKSLEKSRRLIPTPDYQYYESASASDSSPDEEIEGEDLHGTGTSQS